MLLLMQSQQKFQLLFVFFNLRPSESASEPKPLSPIQDNCIDPLLPLSLVSISVLFVKTDTVSTSTRSLNVTAKSVSIVQK